MPRWEYAVVVDGWRIDPQQVPGNLENERRQALQALNSVGQERWELVTVEKFSEVRSGSALGVTFVYFFKRQIEM